MNVWHMRNTIKIIEIIFYLLIQHLLSDYPVILLILPHKHSAQGLRAFQVPVRMFDA